MAYQYWCECLNGKHFITLFFHLLCYHCGTSARPRERELVSFVSMIPVFAYFLEFLPFIGQIFLVTPLHPLAHATICRAEPGVDGKCMSLFTHCWSVRHFLMKNDKYVYKERYFSNGESYQNKKLVGFVNNLGYLGGGVPSAKVDRKHLKHLIDVPLLIGGALVRITELPLVSLKIP